MPYSITYEDAGFIKLTYEGEANVKHLKEVIAHGVSLALERNCFLVLSDFRAMKLNLSLMALFDIPISQIEQSRELKVPFYKFKRAVVVPREHFDKYQFFENVAVNRSHVVKVFIDLEKAVAWLLEK